MNDVRDRIIEDSRPLFAEHGFRRLTMDRIAREMRISKRTIYEHFHSKGELVTAVCASFVEHDARELGKRLDATDDPARKLRALFHIYDLNGFGAAIFKRAELDQLKERFPQAWAQFVGLAESRKQAVAEVYRDGVARGVFPRSYPPQGRAGDEALPTEQTIELITFFASALIDEALQNDLSGYSISLNDALRYTCDMIIQALGTAR